MKTVTNHLVELTLFAFWPLLLSAQTGASVQQTPFGASVTPPALSPPSLRPPTPVPAQETIIQDWHPVERRAHETVHEKTTITLHPVTGQPVQRTHRYTELGSGLNARDASGNFVPAHPEFTFTADGAEARGTAHFVSLASDIGRDGSVQVTTPDGVVLRSHPLSIGYYDPTDGRSVVLAIATNAGGWLVASNEIVYSNCFSGSLLRASMLYHNTRAGLSQNLIIHARPPDPTTFGLSSAASLELTTEFLPGTPAPRKASHPLRHQTHRARSGVASDPALADQTLTFGKMKMGEGRAFTVDTPGEMHQPSAALCGLPVTKQIQTLDGGGQALIEAVPYEKIRPLMERLPAAPLSEGFTNAAVHPADPILPTVHSSTSGTRFLPRKNVAKSTTTKIQMATVKSPLGIHTSQVVPPPKPAFVLDYELLAYMEDYVLQGDTTYLVAGGGTWMSGTTTVSAGTVVKFVTDQDAYAIIYFDGTVVCRTTPQCMAVFTSCKDSTVGEDLSDVTDWDAPTNYFQAMALGYVTNELRYLRVCYAHYAFHAYDINLAHCQVVNGLYAFCPEYGTCRANNVLVTGTQNLLWGTDYQLLATHLTVDQCDLLTYDKDNCPDSIVSFINCLLVNITNRGTVNITDTNHTVFTNTDSVFQTARGGHYYLAEDSPYREFGTTNNIPACLLADLAAMTTYPPTVLGSQINSDTILAPTVPRGTDAAAIGYHYPLLDYLASGVTIASNVTVLLTNGAAVGIDYSQSPWGFIMTAANFLSEGNPMRPNCLLRAHNVQETSDGNPYPSAMFYDCDGAGTDSNHLSQLRLRFTTAAQLATDGYFLYKGQGFSALEWSHSSLYNLSIVVYTGAYPRILVCGVTNTLWEYGGAQFGILTNSSNTSVDLRNNLFRNFSLHLYGETTWSAKDNLFDTSYVEDHAIPIIHSHNAYYQTANLFTITDETGMQVLANLSYDPGPLGPYYQPTNSTLTNAGSCYAPNVGLYHFTTQTNQVKEGISLVDIGLHYVAVTNIGGVWLPIDTDGDGIPDYLEDANGNGVLDPGETSWTDTTDPGLWVRICRPRPGSLIP